MTLVRERWSWFLERSAIDRVLIVLGALALLLLAAIAVFDLEASSREFDAYTQFLGAERIVELGGPYYETASDQKGPLWLASYVFALWLAGSLYNAWFVLAAMIVAIGVATVLLMRRVARASGEMAGAAPLVWGLTGWVCVNLVLGQEEWARVLYSRNIVSLLEILALALLVGLAVPGVRRPLLIAGAAGVALGLAVQTNPSTALTGLPFLGLAWWLGRGRRGVGPGVLRRIPDVAGVFAAGAVLGLGSAFAYYAVRGGLGEFWKDWFEYNRFYTDADATGRGGWEVVSYGYDQIKAIYRQRPAMAVITAVFLLDAIGRRRLGRPIWLDVTLLSWLAVEWVAITASQRFFPHYLILVYVPTATMMLVLAARYGGHVTKRIGPQATLALPVVGALMLVGYARVDAGWDKLRRFESPTQSLLTEYVARLSPAEKQLREVVAANSRRGDRIVVWNAAPHTYFQVERYSATRYPEPRWVLGQIYAGTQDAFFKFNPQWVPEGAWANWMEDVRETPPLLWIDFPEQSGMPEPPPGSPMRELRDCAFVPILDSPEPRQRVLKRVKPVDECLPRPAPSWP